MNTFSALALATLALVATSSAEVLASWDWENLTQDTPAIPSSACDSCVSAGALEASGLAQAVHLAGGVGGSQFGCYAGWDTGAGYSLDRSNLSQAALTLGFDFTTDLGAAGSVSSLSLSLLCSTPDAPTSIQASIFWEDALGAVQSATSGVLAIGPASDWSDCVLTFGAATGLMPSGTEFGGRAFHVEIYASGGAGQLNVDNVALNGQCQTVIPEPGSALLISCIGVLAVARRRLRC